MGQHLLRDKSHKALDPDRAASCLPEKFRLPSGEQFPSSFWKTKKQPDACFKNKLCRRKKENIMCLLPSWSETFEMRRDSKLSGISRALRFVSTFGVRNKGIRVSSLKLPHSIWDCRNNRHVSPSEGKVRSSSTDRNSTTNLDPPAKQLKSHRQGCCVI